MRACIEVSVDHHNSFGERDFFGEQTLLQITMDLSLNVC